MLMNSLTRSLALPLAAGLALAVAGAGEAKAQAPANDLASGAIAIGLDTPTDGTTFDATDNYRTTGSIGSGADDGPDVVYTFTAPGVDRYAVRVSRYPHDGSTNGADWGLFAVAGTLTSVVGPTSITYTSAADFAGANPARAEEIAIQSTFAGQTFTIVVDQDGTLGTPFTLIVTRARFEAEPNNDIADATALRSDIIGSDVAGGTFGDPDFFALGNAAADGSRVFALVDGFSAPSADFVLRVTTATDTIEFDDDDGDTTHTGQFAPVISGAIVPTAGAVFLRVNHLNTTSEPYHVHAVIQPPTSSAVSETEANDSIGQADGPDAGYFGGALTPGDEDFFAVKAHAAGDFVFVGLDCDPDRDGVGVLDGRLELLDAQGVVIISVDGNSLATDQTPSPATLTGDTPFSPAEGLVFMARDATNLFVRVKGFNGSDAGDYLLSIAVNSNKPSMYLDQDIKDFAGTSQGAPGAVVQTVTVTGRSLTDPITVTAPTHFQVRNKTAGGSFAQATATAVPVNGTVTAEFEVQYLPTDPSTPHRGDLVVSSTGGEPESVALRGDLPTVTATGFPLAVFKSTGLGAFSGNQILQVAAIAIGTHPLNITTSANFQVQATATAAFSNAATLTAVNGDVAPVDVNIRYLPTVTGTSHAGTVTISSPAGGTPLVIAVSGKIATISITGTVSAFNVPTLSTASAEQTVSVTATNLDPNLVVTVTPPAEFQVRIGSGAFSSTGVTTTADGSGNLSTTVGVRYLPTSGTAHSGDIVITATGALPQLATVSGSVGSAPPPQKSSGGGCHASGAASTPWPALPFAASALVALAMRGLRRREARA